MDDAATTILEPPKAAEPTAPAVQGNAVPAIPYCAVERPHRLIKALVYGDPFSFKSTFAATFPKPLLVASFDSYGKEAPYLRLGRPTDLYLDQGTPTQLVYHAAEDVVIARIEHYIDADPEAPEAYTRFIKRTKTLPLEIARWGTFVCDALTNAEIMARTYSEFVKNAGNSDGRAHYGYSAREIERFMVRQGGWATNTVLLAHIDSKMDEVHGTMVFNPAAPGQIPNKLPSGFTELLHACATQDEKTKEMRYWLQTVKDNRFNAGTSMLAPNPCRADYEALWEGGRT